MYQTRYYYGGMRSMIMDYQKPCQTDVTSLCKWRHQMETFSTLLVICAGNSSVPVNSPHKGQWRGALMFSLICALISGWVNNGEAGDLRRNRAHCDVIVMRKGHAKFGVHVPYALLSLSSCRGHGLETLTELLALCDGNPQVTGCIR